MAIYTNSANVADKGYMVARSSKIKATDSGHLYDLVDMTNDVEQGCNIKAGEFLGTGYQEREALTPAVGDAIIFVCDVPLVYDAYTQGQNAETNYINVKGKFGDHPVFISDGILVDVPPHMTEDTKEMLKDPEMLEAIRSGRIGFHVYKYVSKTYKKECYAVALDDAADKE